PERHDNIVLGPRQERAWLVMATVKEIKDPHDVQMPPSGKFMLVFEVQAAWRERGLNRSASPLAKHEFDVGVLGESDLQTLLTAAGVPTFLLAPGFLIVIAFVLLWNLTSTNRIALDLKKPEFWSIAILLSMVAAAVYPFLTRPSRSYL